MSTESTELTLQRLRTALPPAEWLAVETWLSTFYPFQIEWLLDWSRVSLLDKARQIGASHTYAGAAALWAMLGELTTVVSKTEEDAREVVRKAGLHLAALDAFGSKWARDAVRNTSDVRLETGGRIVARSHKSGGRSLSGNVLLDEFAYHERPDEVWDASSPVALHGYKIRIISTPNGVGNLFYQFWHDERMSVGWRRHRVTIEEARESGMAVDETACWELAHGDPRLYDQLFRCNFLDGEEQYISTEMVRRCSVPTTSLADGATYAGMDVGLTNDLSALVVIRIDSQGVSWVQEVETWKRTDWETQQARVDDSHRRWKWRRLCIDETGLGKVPAQLLVKRYGGQIVEGKALGGIVEPVSFTPLSKEQMATLLYSAFAKQLVRLPSGDHELRNDVCALKRIITAAGNVRYDAERTSAGHADRAWGLALALHAAHRPTQNRNLSNLPNYR